MLLGIALDKGYIKNLDEKVIDFFPNYTIKKREKTIQHITIRNLLTMTAPYKYKSNPYTKFFSSADWVTSSLDLLGGSGKIGDFRYAPVIGIDILSGILINTTGQSVFTSATSILQMMKRKSLSLSAVRKLPRSCFPKPCTVCRTKNGRPYCCIISLI